MKTCWLNRENNLDCILFMAGWGMGPEPFQTILPGAVDLVMVYDYRNLDEHDISFLKNENKDRRFHLLAWSMGVWLAGKLLGDVAFTSATAIGGTCRPIDDRFGIPCHVFDDTIEHFSTEALTLFYAAMFESSEQKRQFLRHRPQRPVVEIREELTALRAACIDRPEVPDIFDFHIVTSRDRIFPARNQTRAWGRDNCKSIALPHFPFYQWANWANLLEMI